MKYVDKRFIAYKEKQSDGEFSKRERTTNRELERSRYLFYQKYLSKNIDKLWWKNLKNSDKDSIISNYELQEDFLSSSDDRWYSGPVFDSWEEWYVWIKSEFKTNKAGFRNDRLKLLGI
jgi:hypothetical protein